MLKQRVAPHALALVVFLLLTVTFYSPLFFEGKSLYQNDINQGVASGKEVSDFREKTGEEALWTNSMFSGMPAYLINIRWSGSSLLTLAEKILSVGFPASAKETFLSLISFYILLLVFRVRPSLAILGAIAYGFSTFFIISIEAGHLWKVRAIAFAPLVIAGVHLTYSKKYLLGFALTALALALELNSNHLQITYYLFLNLSIYSVVQLIYSIKNKEVLSFAYSSGLIGLASILAVGSTLGKLWSTYEYGKYSTRGESEIVTNESSSGLDRDYAFHWSSGKVESFTYLVPNFYGGASGQFNGKNSDLERVLLQNNVPPNQIQQYTRGLLGYWGPQPFVSGPVYAGAIICFLFVLGIMFADTRYKSWLITATIIAVLLSWGKNFASFNYFIFDNLPMYNKFRAVSMTVVIAMTTMPLLGMIGLEKLLQESYNKRTIKKLLIAFCIPTGLVILIALIAYVPEIEIEIPEWVKNAVISSRKSIIRIDAMRSVFFMGAAFVTLYLFIKGKLKSGLFAIILTVLICIDIIGVDYRYLNSANYVSSRRNTFLTQQPADKIILADETLHFRVLNFNDPFNEARTSAFHKSIGGYHGAKLGRYQDLISSHLSQEIQDIGSTGKITSENTRILSMLNTKYFLVGNTEESVVLNPYALGNAWFVQKLIEVKNPTEELSALETLDIRNEAVINTSNFKSSEFQYDSLASIKLESYAPNKLIYSATTPVNAYAVFSEIYYPEGWKAFINGIEQPIDQVNYILRGMKIPQGQHQIEFRFEPNVYFVGNKISWASSIVMFAVIGAALFISFKRTSNGKD